MAKNEMQDWISVNDEMPNPCVKVLATFKNSMGNSRRICGHYVPRFTVESDCEEESHDEYCVERDNYFLCEGWYENIENWGDFNSVYVCEGEITHWMPLPKAP